MIQIGTTLKKKNAHGNEEYYIFTVLGVSADGIRMKRVCHKPTCGASGTCSIDYGTHPEDWIRKNFYITSEPDEEEIL
jgi:hypothetical protein